ncbi:iron-siderophore ABC transporter substrate-binding protein [Inquilinus sp. CAU 1745]|uniref:iron-siderophore ABC transporter substrate-binding protein n=1 Tax=Inquilinus sp. CAU 1745 TaxID=3140369 RepID=UPI00325AFE39
MFSKEFGRRAFVAGCACAAVAPWPLRAAEPVPERIVSLDYGLATTLLALGVTPVGVAGAVEWHKWVVEPELPPEVADVGLDREVNVEVLAALDPDLILATPYVAHLTPLLERIAPVEIYGIYTAERRPLALSVAATRDIGALIGRPDAAEAYIGRADRFLSDCAARLSGIDAPPLALVNFMDARHARIYGGGSLYQGVLDRLGLENAWTGPSNDWGFQTIGIEMLATASPDLRLVSFEPIPPDVLPTLDHSPLWTQLPFVREGRVSTLPSTLMFGMVPAALRFASLITDHLVEAGT